MKKGLASLAFVLIVITVIIALASCSEQGCVHEVDKVNIETVVHPTCTEEGEFEYVLFCGLCNEEMNRIKGYTDKVPHTPGCAITENNVPPSCKSEGSYDEVVNCVYCNAEIRRVKKTVAKLDTHSPGEVVVENFIEPTCTAEGNKDEVIYCLVCDIELSRTSIKIQKTDHISHSTIIENYIIPSCSSFGSYDEVIYCYCGYEYQRETYKISMVECTDSDDDNRCDYCNKIMSSWEEDIVEWETTPLIFMLTENSNNQELPSTCKRYMAGDSDDREAIDVKVRQRNDAAYAKTKVSVTYDYYTDDSKYGWGSCVEDMLQKINGNSTDRPDMFCNFICDIMTVSLKSGFANLYSHERGIDALSGKNYFRFADNPDLYEDTGDGYMYEYMRSLSLSKHKMYCLSSDYFTDMVRAFFVVPVNVNLINKIPVDLTTDNAFNSDRTGDGKFTIDDFYQLVYDGQWNYQTLAAFSAEITADNGDDTSTTTLDDRIGFATSSSSYLSASGFIYSSSVTIINRVWSEAWMDYDYYYPNPYTDEGRMEISDLVNFADNLNWLFSQTGIISVNNSDPLCNKYSALGDSLAAIRNRFANNRILFGGVICLGSLEYDEYQYMKDNEDSGFGVAPVPLYRDVNPDTGKPDSYLTASHNVGRIGAISNKTFKFVQCTAFLDYQSTHSSDIISEYYDYKLKYDVEGGINGNREMLKYIRYNVRSGFDNAYEDVIGKYYSSIDENAQKNLWHTMIHQADYKLTTMNQKYVDVYQSKSGYLKSLWNDYASLPN